MGCPEVLYPPQKAIAKQNRWEAPECTEFRGLGFRVQGSGFRISGVGGLGFGAGGLRLRSSGGLMSTHRPSALEPSPPPALGAWRQSQSVFKFPPN